MPSVTTISVKVLQRAGSSTLLVAAMTSGLFHSPCEASMGAMSCSTRTLPDNDSLRGLPLRCASR
ncbi:MAG: hypothetical protein IPG49_00020 [Proteobacteria bacterium]|nr:hypothetical protein [Pseudomonadota bacterium]